MDFSYFDTIWVVSVDIQFLTVQQVQVHFHGVVYLSIYNITVWLNWANASVNHYHPLC